jgi:spastin
LYRAAQFEGLGTSSEDRVLVMGATNTPHELDTAAIRRFPIRIYVPMPDVRMRAKLIGKLLEQVTHVLNERDLTTVSKHLEGYSASDVAALVREAAMGPIRALGDRLEHTPASKVRLLFQCCSAMYWLECDGLWR